MIQIKDNFFSDINKIKESLQKIPVYSAKDWEASFGEKMKWQGTRSLDFKSSHSNLFDTIKKNIQDTFEKKYIINTMCLHERKDDKMNPHVDNIDSDTNCLIFVTGKEGFCNGTGFYNDKELSIAVGFKENRALLFPSNHLHSCMQALYPDIATSRVTINCFMSVVEN